MSTARIASPAALVLAAGQGTRMKSDLPKVLHPVAGVPMVQWVVRALRQAGVERIVVVIGHGGDQVQAALGDSVEFAWQREQLGTGHAVLQAREQLGNFDGPVLVVAGDVPMISGATLRGLWEDQAQSGAACVMSTFELEDPTGYGRILRDTMHGGVTAVVEHKDCSSEQRKITEVNPAIYCFDNQRMFAALDQVGNDNSQGEYYLPDVIKIFVKQGETIKGVLSDDPDEFRGINDKWQLAEAGAIVRERILKSLAVSGVSIVDPGSTHIGPDVMIGKDTVIHPNCVIEGSTSIGAGCQIGPNSWIKDSEIGDSCRVFMSHMERATMAQGCRLGPFSNLRPGAVLKEEAKIGNFVEIKNSELGAGVSASHLTYIGDASVGDGTNIGAGTITCNYDGFSKHRTEIGRDCFVGSNSTLVAPITIGDDVLVAAGSVLTKDVPSGALAVARSRQENKEDWFVRWREWKRGSNG